MQLCLVDFMEYSFTHKLISQFFFCRGNDINITHKLDANRVKQKYLKSIGRLRKNHEDMWGHYYINVCELRPSNPEGNGHFVKMMNYLGRHDCVSCLCQMMTELEIRFFEKPNTLLNNTKLYSRKIFDQI